MNDTYGSVRNEGAQEYQGMRVDHPELLRGVKNLLKLGYSNEHIVRIIGLPPSVVDRERNKWNASKGK